MEFRDYTYVKAIAEYKTLSKAADMLYISEPALSKYLRGLEDRMGTPLFKRVNHQLWPTYAGELFLKAGEEILVIQNQFNRSLDKIRNHEVGKLNVAVTSIRGYYIFPKVYPKLVEKYPNLRLNIMDVGIEEVEKKVDSGEADLGIYTIEKFNRSFRNYPIRQEEVILCLPHSNPYQEYAIAKKDRSYPWIDLSLLKDEQFFVNDPKKWRISNIANKLLKDAGIHPEISILGNLETCLSLAAAGMGAAFSYDICVQSFENYVDRPCYYSVGEEKHTAEFTVITRKGYELTPPEKDFIEYIRRMFGGA